MKSISVSLSLVFIVAGSFPFTDKQINALEISKTKNNVTSRQLPRISRITVKNSGHNARAKDNFSVVSERGQEPVFRDAIEHPRIVAEVSTLSQFLWLLTSDLPRRSSRRPSRIRHPNSSRASHQQHNAILSRTGSAGTPVEVSSGQNIRLVESNRVNEGIVKVKLNNRWGYICRDDLWSESNARVVCRQLGFSSAAENASSANQSRRIAARELFAMNRVRCSGTEDDIQACTFSSSSSCSGSRAVRVNCSPNPGCENGWLAGNGFCYKLVKTAVTFYDAEAGCRSLESYLVKIDSQQESNFVSNLLMAERADGAVWTSGRKMEQNGLQEWRWLGSSHAIQFTKWFPGFSSVGSQSQPSIHGNHSCISLSKTFRDVNNISQEVGYYFWMSLPCAQSLQYICKKVIQTNDCYEENGSNYRGTAFVTTRASLCQKWTESSVINPSNHQNAGLGDHNYCRNPDGDERPWCWVNAVQGRYGYCALSSCPRRDSSLSIPSSTDVPLMKVRLRDGRHSHEGRVEVWYDGQWGNVCDDQWGMADADVVCRQLGYIGALRTSTQLEFSSGDGVNILLDEVQCTGLENSIYECLHGPWSQHDCRFYETAGVICKPNKVCVEEKEVQCAGSNGQICVPLTYICDKEWDCSDGADETNCTYFEIALVDGNRPTEGRVQITINNITGTICDDDWDDRDAAVICHMLGYSTGTAQAVTGAQFGQGRGPIWLDNVDCAGHEEDIEECDHPAWGEHNCMHNEDAGVSCMTSGRTYAPRITYNPVVRDCGRRPILQPTAKIIGGQHAVYGAYPWQARIMKRNTLGEFVHSCGGTIIDHQWILSAAHCFEHTRTELLRIRVGDHRSSAIEMHEQEFAVSQLFVHSSYLNMMFMHYGHARYDNDIALVKLQPTRSQTGIRFNNHVQPACLPTASTEYRPGIHCEVSGWGLSERSTPNVLMSALLPIRQQAECQSLYSHKLSRKMFCAGYRDGRADTCQGDSGGPLVCQVNGTHTIMGITSWGLGCASRDSPGVYTKVGEFTDWILQTIRSNS